MLYLDPVKMKKDGVRISRWKRKKKIAIAAMRSLIIANNESSQTITELAKRSYDIAEAMLAEDDERDDK